VKARYRRQRQQFLFAGTLGVIGIVNLLFFLILYRPARSEYQTSQESIRKLRQDVQMGESAIDRLEKLHAQLETSAQDRARLFTMHFIPRREGWSQILAQLDMLAREAGVKNTRKDYAIDQMPQYGLYSVKIAIPVSGPYSNVVNFIKSLESTETFFIINSIDVRGSESPGETEIAVSLNAETFFYQ
jgi:Tfp pilus assembly protein PilO